MIETDSLFLRSHIHEHSHIPSKFIDEGDHSLKVDTEIKKSGDIVLYEKIVSKQTVGEWVPVLKLEPETETWYGAGAVTQVKKIQPNSEYTIGTIREDKSTQSISFAAKIKNEKNRTGYVQLTAFRGALHQSYFFIENDIFLTPEDAFKKTDQTLVGKNLGPSGITRDQIEITMAQQIYKLQDTYTFVSQDSSV